MHGNKMNKPHVILMGIGPVIHPRNTHTHTYKYIPRDAVFSVMQVQFLRGYRGLSSIERLDLGASKQVLVFANRLIYQVFE